MLFVLSSSVKFIRKAAAVMLLSLLALSCQMTDDYDCETDFGNARQYINVTISVSADSNPVTRAPQGGEYGDGSEKGQDRENVVNNITLIFYEDATGINTTAEATVACVQTYTVRAFTQDDYNNLAHTHKPGESSTLKENEVLYTTGDQKMEGTGLEAGKTYKLLVVANANGEVNVNVGDKIKTDGSTIGLRDKVIGSIYTGTGTGVGIDATNFVMTSEDDATVILTNPTLKEAENKLIYYFNCIHMERLAARIDYYTTGSEYKSEYGGYKYNLGTSDNDGFYVVTSVTPFNLYNENEYLFKRVQNNWSAESVTTYLGDETESVGETAGNYVVDPKTNLKDNDDSHTLSYLSPIAQNMTNAYTVAMNSENISGQRYFIGNYHNIIIAYAKENTLMPSSYLKKYATGIAFEAKYYANASATPVTHVFYHYLRHQGEKASGSYQAKEWLGLNDTEVSNTNVSMNYGVVRNNIYRVEISGFTDRMQLKIKVKKWDKFTHEVIYM